MDGALSDIFVGLLILLGTFARMNGCREVYPSDRLNVSTCDSQKLILGWNIAQKIYDINLQYLCINPSGVNVSTPSLNAFIAQVSSTTVRGVSASPGATCWFWACYKASNVNGLIYSVPSQSCVVQSFSTSNVILITPSATSPYQIVTQASFTSSSSSQIQFPPSNTQYSYWLPSAASLEAVPLSLYPSFTFTPLYEGPTLLPTTSVVKISCDSLWCSHAGYIATSIVVSLVLILIILTITSICSVVIRKRNLSKRTHDLQSIGYKMNEKFDPNFTPAALSSLHVFKSVESQLDSLHLPSLSEIELKETSLDDSHTDDYIPESACTEDDPYQTDISESTCTIFN